MRSKITELKADSEQMIRQGEPVIMRFESWIGLYPQSLFIKVSNTFRI